ncbi:MAG: Asp-tRNA(Asn)/Glu-tRNA(Gln) amidotransferase subunit GatA [Ignavibacteriae bacterium]|nr:Asp-tRNA(Asn)/Glu-tRNA(Gln) amidotransferase subunit GatA [Ignavibacteriota bacterium]
MNTYTIDRERLLSGGTTCAQLYAESTARAEALSHLHAYLEQYEDSAVHASKADASFVSSNAASLEGMLVAVKDNISVQGKRLGCASRILEGFTALYDATAIARLRAAGAVFTGRTNMDEFAMGSSTENSAYGPTHNPHDHSRVPGGSSGGSAVAVATGMAHVALGSETGGSVRQPAAFTGVLGLKPTYGRVSRHGLVAFASSLDQIGVFARSAMDAALVLDAISGHDTHDATTAQRAATDVAPFLETRYAAALQGARIGIPRECMSDALAPSIRRAVERTCEVFRSAGADIVPLSLPRLEDTIAVYSIIATAEASSNLARFDGARYGARVDGARSAVDSTVMSRAAGFGDEVKRRILLGTYALSAGYYEAYYLKAQRVRRLLREDFDAAFRDVTMLLTPTTPSTAFRLGEKTGDPLAMYLSDLFTASVNLAGLPALSVPAGRDDAGLPIGVQCIAPAFGEEILLLVARLCEEAGLDA